MDNTIHHFHDLFAQLGLPYDNVSIEQFIGSHSPLAPEVKLPEASFWTSAQATFLREACVQDADWAGLADQLNVALRKPTHP
ncbi:DUF2789 domain-containing protein [Rhodoferax sp.]|uniref:DUF2789 domain-containing protein n=1 Tax=Rhodoferax sp. TaxID=50421 RepID=UPI0025DD29BB|nr:DUF2789 domain-containing protein [Rhodoferax sp.]MCM2295193.1 DUF2789 domain-containing protein [Rhodoferax sp.]